MSTQTIIDFPHKKKPSNLKFKSDKMKSSISSRRSVVLQDVSTDTSTRTRLRTKNDLRKTRSTSTLPQTPKSNKKSLSKEVKTPKSQSTYSCNVKTPSTLLREMTINSPKTPSALLSKLKLDSPKRKIDKPLEFSSPKRKLNSIESIEQCLSSLSDDEAETKHNASPKKIMSLRKSSPKLKLLFHEKSNEISPQKHSSRIKTFGKTIKSLEISEESLTSPKRSLRPTNSPFKKIDSLLDKTTQPNRCSVDNFSVSSRSSKNITNSPFKNNLENIDSSLPRKTSIRSSSQFNNHVEKLNSPGDILEFLKSTENSPLKKSSKNSKSHTKLELINDINKRTEKSNVSSTSLKNVKNDIHSKSIESLTSSPRQSLRIANSPYKVNDSTKIKLFEEKSKASTRTLSPEQNENVPASPKRSLRITNSPASKVASPKIKLFTDTSKELSLSSPNKKSPLKPISPIKNIILDQKSPFKPFIKDAPILSPSKLRPARKLFDIDTEENKPLKEDFSSEHVRKYTSPLPGRESQLKDIREFLLNHINNESSGSMYISGPPGTGKSASLQVITEDPSIAKDVKTIYINCNMMRTAASVYEKIVSELKLSPQGKSERYQLTAIMKHFETKHKTVLLILDEIDALETKKQTILYTIFEWPAIKKSKLVLIGIANALDLTDRMLPRLQANVTLKPKLMNFAPYSREQILEIITKKLKETDKFNMFNATALHLLSGKIAAVSGDIRKAIDITNHLIDLTYDSVKENGEVSIGLKEVLSVINSVYCTSQSLNCSKDEDSFPLQQKLTLASFLLMKSKQNIKEVTLGKLHEIYRKVCSHRNLQPLDMSEFTSACSLLDARGVLKIYGKTKNRQSKVTLQWDEQDVKEAMRDKHLISSILNEITC